MRSAAQEESFNKMSAEPMIRQLFQSLETTLHERLSLIEQVLNTIEKPKVALYDNEFVKRIERLEYQQRHSSGSGDLEHRILALEHQSGSRFLEDRIVALEEQLAATCAELEAVKNKDPVVLHEKEVSEVASEVEMVLDEEEAQEEEAPEEAAVELEEFQHKGVTYFRDGDNKVYTTDEDGVVIPEPIALWNGVMGAGSKFLRIQ
jgi:hypothetical protein